MLKKAFLIGLLFCAGCVPMGASGPTLEERVEQQDMELKQMRPQQAETVSEVQALRQEINDLKGQLDELNRAGGAGALAQRVQQHDAALRQVDDSMALNLGLGEPMQTKPAGTPPATTVGGTNLPAPVMGGQTAGEGITIQGAPDSSAYRITKPATAGGQLQAQTQPNAPGQQMGSYGLPPEPAENAKGQTGDSAHVEAPSESTWGQADPQQVVVQAPKKDISLALFDAGLNDYHARKYAAAKNSFSDFVKNYPGHSQMQEAMYYLGECDFMAGKYAEAAISYNNLLTKYPKSSFTPAAYFKQGLSFSKMNQKAAARATMNQLIAKFPKSPEAARAKTFLKTNK